MRVLTSRRSLAWRVFFTNAAVLAGVSAFLVFSPATISSPVAVSELLVLLAALAVTLLVNVFMLERAFRPLDQLRQLMQTVDPLEPGHRIELPSADADVGALAEAFNAMLDRLETERRESARRALAAQEDERRRVARELHDELGQTLTGVLLLVDEASKAPPRRAGAAIEEGREALRNSIEEVRRIVRDLRPEALDDLGLPSAMATMAGAFERHTGIPLDREVPAAIPHLSREQELVLYRVVQEALTNVARHSGAGRAGLVVACDDGRVSIAVRDDGRGFKAPPPDHGGINGMRERALLVRGTVDVSSQLGEGTQVVLSIPLHER